MAGDVTKEVLAAEERRCAAIAAQDWEALDAIVAEEFSYTHSVGKTEDKAAWIAGIKNAVGRWSTTDSPCAATGTSRCFPAARSTGTPSLSAATRTTARPSTC